jgi:hypothetical protein
LLSQLRVCLPVLHTFLLTHDRAASFLPGPFLITVNAGTWMMAAGNNSFESAPGITVVCGGHATNKGGCSALCGGGGLRGRTRSVVVPGFPCLGALNESGVACNSQPCGPDKQGEGVPSKCTVSAWGAWQPCSTVCNGGTQNHTRQVLQRAQVGGAPCPSVKEQRPCNTEPCICAPTAGQTCTVCPVCCKSYIPNGAYCDKCAKLSCPVPVDCLVSNWSAWSVCNGGCKEGQRSRTRTVERAAANGGAACPALNEVAKMPASAQTTNPTAAPTAGPSMFPTGYPTAAPTPLPTPTPTSALAAVPTAHPCNSGAALCDKGKGGTCHELVGYGPATWTCSCKVGFICSHGCSAPYGGHACKAQTTKVPVAGPVTVPTAVPVSAAAPSEAPTPVLTLGVGPHPCDSGVALCDKGKGGSCHELAGHGPALWTCSCKVGYYCVRGCGMPHGGHTCAPHPCFTGLHTCDRTHGGICYETSGASYTCGCKEGYWQHASAPHTCMLVTAAPTPSPTRAPTAVPSPSPTRSPSPAPTPHPCTDGSHDCDKTDGGICYETGATSHKCGCKAR